MVNYKVIVSYDGTRYKGWQHLGEGELTIQDTLESAIKNVLDYTVQIHGSGRTDAGVHAKGQVFNMKVPFRITDEFQKGVNAALPDDIRILSVERTNGNFHARYSTVKKVYCYYIDTNEKQSVFQRKYTYHFPHVLDLEAMQKAKNNLIGKHDFSSFTDDKMSEKDKIRVLEWIKIKEKKGIITLTYCGDGFLQHMVRILTGTLLEVGQGRRKPEEIPMILEKKERAAAGFLVPAKGLFLDTVYYLEK